jgi:hypothetical protein
MRNWRRRAGTRHLSIGGSTADSDSCVTLAKLGALEVGLGRLWWRLTAMTSRSRRPDGVRSGDVQRLRDEIALLAGSVAPFDNRCARQLSQQLDQLRRHLAAAAYDPAGENDPERRIAAGALEPVRDHLASLREQVARAARPGARPER